MNKQIEHFLHCLHEDLRKPLPGRPAQYQMAPQPRPSGALPYDQPRPDARQSGVLVLLYPHHGTLYLPLILRPTYNGVHSGQVGFPGGGFEAGDMDITATALREAYEEIGVLIDQVVVLGQLSSLYVFASNNLVFPTLAWTAQRPIFKVDPDEVAQLLEVPLPALLAPSNRYEEEWQLRDRVAKVPFYAVQQQKIWGATAMMLSELLALSAMQVVPGLQQWSARIADSRVQD